MTAQPVFPNAPFKSHMPFFDGKTLLFCRADGLHRQEFLRGGSIWERIERDAALRRRFGARGRLQTVTYRAWKLAYASWGHRRPHRITTGMPAGAVECSPAFYRREGTWFVSFIGGVPRQHRILYHLYGMSGPSLDGLARPRIAAEAPTRVGFVSPEHICVGHGSRLLLTDRRDGSRAVLDCPMAEVYRATFCPDHVDRLLVSGRSGGGQPLTLLYRLDIDQTWELRAPGPVYKSCLWGRRIIFAKQGADDFEDRALWHGPFYLLPFHEKIRRRNFASV